MSATEQDFVHPEFLVETEWLAQHLGDAGLCILDCTTNLIPDPKIVYHIIPARAEFEQGHIPGAQFVDVPGELSDRNHRFRFMTPSAAAFADAMGRLGVGEGTHVVTYSTGAMWWATRVWWMLRTFGFDNAAVLNGGWQKWSREGRPAETGPARPPPPARFVVRERRPLMVGREEVERAIGDASVCTLNALSAQQHAGTGGTVYGRVGRIAGSVNLPAAQLIDPASNTLLPAAVLRQKFDAIGAFDKRVISYCGGGISATTDALALVMLGHPDVAVYDASLAEWAVDPSLPMETG
jgi:thiosulfate/3-mercaptopyruvate sulfurtransferase